MAFFPEDFSLDLEEGFPKASLLCDVLLSSSENSQAARTSSDHSPELPDTSFVCVPSHDSGVEPCSPQRSSSYDMDMQYSDDLASPAGCVPGARSHHPLAAPEQSFPEVDLGSLRRRNRGDSNASTRTSSSRKKSPTIPESEIVVPVRVSARNDSRKRRSAEDPSRRSALQELSEEERLEKNRQSARDCRQRKKRYIESLERRISEFEKRETVMTATISRLEDQLSAIFGAKIHHQV